MSSILLLPSVSTGLAAPCGQGTWCCLGSLAAPSSPEALLGADHALTISHGAPEEAGPYKVTAPLFSNIV